MVLLAMALSARACFAQRRPLGENVSPIALRLTITIDGDAEKAAYATVELMDAVGSSSAMSQKLTDNDGRVMFQTFPGLHRIRITGPSIRPYEGELEILPNEVSHVERIRVHAAEARPPTSESPPGGP